MSTTSDLEGNDSLEHVTLVRMEDIQPEKSPDIYLDEESMNACVIENLEYDNECIIDDGDDDYTIGSMVPIKWGAVEDIDDDSQEEKPKSTRYCRVKQEKKPETADDSNDTGEYIVPDMMKDHSVKNDSSTDNISSSPNSWPTLEILPGGVIKDVDKFVDALNIKSSKDKKKKEMVYACAKCSINYKDLCCLVRHVKWHEEQEKKIKSINTTSTTRSLLKPFKKSGIQQKKEKAVIRRIVKVNCDVNKTKSQILPSRTKRKTNLS